MQQRVKELQDLGDGCMKTWVDGFLELQLHSFLVMSFWTGFYLVLHFGKGMMVKRNAAFARILLIALPVGHQKAPYSAKYSIFGTVA